MFFWISLCFFNDPADVGNLISGSSTFSKSSLYICMFSVHVLLEPNLKDFEHYLASMWNECNCVVVWTFVLPFFGTDMKTDLFQSCGHYWVFQIYWHIECSTFTASPFRTWNSSAGIASPRRALFVVLLPRRLLPAPGGLALGGHPTARDTRLFRVLSRKQTLQLNTGSDLLSLPF